MIQSHDEILALVGSKALLEHRFTNLELKESWSQGHGSKIAGLANKNIQGPSWLVVGVKDDGSLAGRDEKWVKGQEEVISQHINQNLDPLQAVTSVSAHKANGSWIILVGICNPGEVVYWNKAAYYGAGTTFKELDPKEIMDLRMKLPGLTDFSAQPADGLIDSELVHLFGARVEELRKEPEFDGFSGLSAEEILQRLNLHGRQASRLLFNGGTFRVVYYDSSDEPSSNETVTGLYRLLTASFAEAVQSWSQNHLGSAGPPYPPRALKETLANAVAHAAYLHNDGDIIVEVYADHIAVSNLCLPESEYFANRWFSRSHNTINGVLMEALRIAGHVDELGRGKSIIFADAMRNGKRPPEVHIEGAGRYERWKLILFAGSQDELLLRMLERNREVYKDELKALIATALVLWRDKPVSEIRNYVDGDFSRQFAEVLGGSEGPIFYDKDTDAVHLRRWARILIGEGKDSKAFAPAEERQLRTFAARICSKYHDGFITPMLLRELGGMANSRSEQVLSSQILKRWEAEGHVTKVRRGSYAFTAKKAPSQGIAELLKLFEPRQDVHGA